MSRAWSLRFLQCMIFINSVVILRWGMWKMRDERADVTAQPGIGAAQWDPAEEDAQAHNQQASHNSNSNLPVMTDPVYLKKGVPLIWIGGVPRSGTTLMRAILDAHPAVRCGEETRIVPRLLNLHDKTIKSPNEMERLAAANINRTVLEEALGAYLLTIIAKHGQPAPRLCNKDPYTLRHISSLRSTFPRSKFLLMIRDGRATVHSIMERNITITGFFRNGNKDYRTGLAKWNNTIAGMYASCLQHGPSVCLPVYYEQLVLHTERQMRIILDFLRLPWDDKVLHHELEIGQKDGVSLSRLEASTSQVVHPVNALQLNKWAKNFPADVRRDIDSIAPMLRTLGYNQHAYPPQYGQPDTQVLENTLRLAEHVRRKQP